MRKQPSLVGLVSMHTGVCRLAYVMHMQCFNVVCKDMLFTFDNNCLLAFENLKEKLITAPIITGPNWTFNFEIMCDANDYVVGDVRGQRKTKVFHVIHHARKVLNDVQVNYPNPEKELITIVYAL